MSALSDWLAANGLGQYAETFAANDIELDLLPSLDDADLRELGLSLGHRKRFAQAVASFEAPVSAAPADPEGDRRPVTVLFADITGFTKMSAELGAEYPQSLLEDVLSTFPRAS